MPRIPAFRTPSARIASAPNASRAAALAAAVAVLAVAVAASVLAPAAPALAAEGVSWSVAPADTAGEASRGNFDYQLDPGTALDDAFLVRNDGSGVLDLAVYAADAFTTREGNIDLLAAGTTSLDAGTWVTLDTDRVSLQAGESAVIPFTVTVPADAQPGDHTAGIVASLLSQDPDAQVQVDRRLGSRMYIRVGGDLVPAVEAGGLTVRYTGSWNPLAIGTVDVGYTLANTGNTRVTALSALDTAGPFGAASTRTGDVQLPEVLPGSEIEVSHTITGVGALLWLSGAVDIRPSSVGLGAARLDAVTLPYTVAAVPATLLIILGGVAIITATLLLGRRRRLAAAGLVT